MVRVRVNSASWGTGNRRWARGEHELVPTDPALAAMRRHPAVKVLDEPTPPAAVPQGQPPAPAAEEAARLAPTAAPLADRPPLAPEPQAVEPPSPDPGPIPAMPVSQAAPADVVAAPAPGAPTRHPARARRLPR